MDVLKVTGHPLLVSIDGLAGVETVSRQVDLSGNPNLCYILSETPSKEYWEVKTDPQPLLMYIDSL